jgi:hypothetical protein
MPSATVIVLSPITGTNTTGTWNFFPIRSAQMDNSNPSFVRQVLLTQQGVYISRNNANVGFFISDLLKAAANIAPALTWPPWIQVQPSNNTAVQPTAISFSVLANSEVTAITYQWQVSTTNSGWSNVSNGGVYSNATTNTLNISNNAGLSGYVYRVLTTNASGNTYSNSAAVIVDPNITSQPSNAAVTAPAPASFVLSANSPLGYGLTYQWQLWGGSSFSNVSGGVYSNVTTNTLNISNSTGLNGKIYRCLVTDINGTSDSGNGTLTVS